MSPYGGVDKPVGGHTVLLTRRFLQVEVNKGSNQSLAVPNQVSLWCKLHSSKLSQYQIIGELCNIYSEIAMAIELVSCLSTGVISFSWRIHGPVIDLDLRPCKSGLCLRNTTTYFEYGRPATKVILRPHGIPTSFPACGVLLMTIRIYE